jgi:3-oxoacyl-[acyl-carrier protein] reductase
MSYELTGLEGKVAVVTGAGRLRSIGRPIAIALAQAGCDIVLTGTGRALADYPEDEKELGWRDVESVAEEIAAVGRRAVTVIGSVADPEDVQSLLATTIDEYGRVDIVVNNAGAARGADRVPVVDLPIAEWTKVIDVNLNGTFLMSKFFGQKLIEQGDGGSIVNISSIAGKLLSANTAAYGCSKAAIQGLTASMASEVGQYGIRVNAICPGIIDTFRMDDLGREETWEQLVKERIPLGRAGTGEDIAHQVVYLCSDQGEWITGQSYTVDGGTVPGR